MNKREQAKKQAAVMLKYANGAEIESSIRMNVVDCWVDNDNPIWKFNTTKYRVKQSGSDKVRSMLSHGKPTLCGVSCSKQCSADANAEELSDIVVIYSWGGGVFHGENANQWTYASPVNLSQFATLEDSE